MELLKEFNILYGVCDTGKVHKYISTHLFLVLFCVSWVYNSIFGIWVSQLKLAHLSYIVSIVNELVEFLLREAIIINRKV